MRTVVGELGWCLAKMEISDEGMAERVTICSPAHTNEDRYAPAESVEVYGRENLMKLKAFLDQHLAAAEVKT